MTEKGKELFGDFQRALIPSEGLHSENLITSQRSPPPNAITMAAGVYQSVYMSNTTAAQKTPVVFNSQNKNLLAKNYALHIRDKKVFFGKYEEIPVVVSAALEQLSETKIKNITFRKGARVQRSDKMRHLCIQNDSGMIRNYGSYPNSLLTDGSKTLQHHYESPLFSQREKKRGGGGRGGAGNFQSGARAGGASPLGGGPPKDCPHAPPRARSRLLGRRNPPSGGAQPALTTARPAHPPRRRRASLPSPGPAPQGTRAAAGTKGAPPARARPPRRSPSSAALTCRRPRAWAAAPAAAAASPFVVALARRLRPPPPRSLSLPPPPALMRDPRFVLRSPRPGEGAQRPQEAPRPSPRRSAAARPRRGSQGPPAGLGASADGPACRARRSRGRRRRPRARRPSAEAKRKSARRRMARARAGGGLRRGGVRERAEGAVSMLPRRRVGLYRLLQSPRAERHHLGKNADLAAAAQAGRTSWAGRVSRQAARTARRGEGSRPGRSGAGRGQGVRGRALRSAPPQSSAPPPSCLPSSQRKGGWEREVVRWLFLAVPPRPVAIFVPRRGFSSS
ncbi:translation initiation factor IF-2-like [Moschus berezovskii]|uniref:translation initiation factor IF-2-like n=1 Tax=Moschus berezovskii TaxID=68408 RepID=UPI0024439A22|nr:translation initiation factor IF-2-like [Moschus berezovskii]